MIEELKPYSAYRNSGVEWLKDIPNHWQTERAKWLFQKMDRPVREHDEVVTCFRDGTVTLRKNRRVQGFTESIKEIGYQGVRQGDLVIHGMDAFAGAIGVSDSDGKSTPVYSVCQPREGVDARFYSYIIREMARNQWILALAKGIRERSTDFRFSMFASLVVPFPPIEEQEAITHFLNYADRRIRRYIRTKQKLIKLLEEQKQVGINEAVTRGFASNTSFSPSSIEWLGDIPDHWEVVSLKRLLSRMDYGTSESLAGEGSIRVLTMGNIQNGEITFPKSGSLKSVNEKLILSNHDLLFNRTNSPDLVGKVGIFRGDTADNISFASYLVRLRVNNLLCSPHWLNYFLNCRSFWGYAKSQALVSLHQANLNSTRYGQFLIPVPPLREQTLVAEHLDCKTHSLDTAKLHAEDEISLVREFRTRLIADVVTGKLDVREAASKLPTDVTDAESSDADLTEDDIVTADDLDFDESLEDEAA